MVGDEWDCKKNLAQSTKQRSASLLGKEVKKPYCRERLEWMHKIFFWLPNLKKMILFGGRSGSCVSGDEKAKSGSYGALDATMTYSTLCHNGYRMW